MPADIAWQRQDQHKNEPAGSMSISRSLPTPSFHRRLTHGSRLVSMQRCIIWAVTVLLAQSAADDDRVNIANMRVKMTKYGLDYTSEIGAAIVNTELLSLNVPPLESDFSGGTLSTDNIRVTSLLPPTYNYRLTEPNTVIWSINGGRLTVEGHYSGSVMALFVPVSGSGPFKATVNGLQLTVRVLVSMEQSRPKVDVIDCQSDLNDVDLEIGGGIVGWLMNRIDEHISSQLPPKLHALVCERVTSFVDNDVNNKLRTIPITVMLGNSAQLDYGLMATPTVLSNSVELRHKGEILSGDENAARSSPVQFKMFEPSSFNESEIVSSKMLLIEISDGMFNSYLYRSFHSGSYSLVIDKATNPERAKFLDAQCSETELCIGNYLADYRQAYSNAAISAVLELSGPANVKFEDGSAQCKANGSISLMADGHVILAVNVSVEAALTASVQSQADRTLLKGLLSITSLVVSSAGMGEIASLSDPIVMDNMIDLAKLVFEAEINDILNTGAPIPMPHGTKLTDIETMFVDNQLLLFCDFEYLPANGTNALIF